MAGAFQTPQNERSFSALIDEAIVESGKFGALRSVVQYANLTIRECQALVLSFRDMTELEVTATDSPFVWEKPIHLRSFRAVRYATQDRFAKLRMPGQVQDGFTFYAVDGSYVFKGTLPSEVVQIAYYSWVKPLIYYGRLGTDTTRYQFGPYADRKAYYDLELEAWYYLSNGAYVTSLGDTGEEETRRRNALHWLLEDWYDMILDGTKAKLFKQFNDDRAAISYANYKTQQFTFQSTSGFEAEGFINKGE